MALAFAREGAKIFLAGRTIDAVQAVAKDITAQGGFVEAAQVEAMDATAVREHADDVVRRHGSIDISFNAIGPGGVSPSSMLRSTEIKVSASASISGHRLATGSSSQLNAATGSRAISSRESGSPSSGSTSPTTTMDGFPSNARNPAAHSTDTRFTLTSATTVRA